MANSAATGEVQGPQGVQADMTRSSTTSITIGTGSQSFTFTAPSPDLGWIVGTRLRAASAGNVSNFMDGNVTAVSSTAVTINVDITGGSGTHADWNISIVGVSGAGVFVSGSSGDIQINNGAGNLGAIPQSTFATPLARTTITKTTASLANNAFETGTITTLGKTFECFRIIADRTSRVRLYSTSALRDADTLRGNTPQAGGLMNGCILDVAVNGSASFPLTFTLSEAAVGSNADTGTAAIYYTITNYSGSTSTVQIQFVVNILES